MSMRLLRAEADVNMDDRNGALRTCHSDASLSDRKARPRGMWPVSSRVQPQPNPSRWNRPTAPSAFCSPPMCIATKCSSHAAGSPMVWSAAREDERRCRQLWMPLLPWFVRHRRRDHTLRSL